MKTEIEFSPSYSLLTVRLEPGETIRAEPGAMVAQQDVEMQTGVGGGVFGAARRMLGGESFVMNFFTGGPEGGWVCLAPPCPGDIRSFEVLPGSDLFIQSGSFLACSGGVEVDSRFQGFRGFFSGERLFFLRAFTGDERGEVFYNSYGAIREVELEPGRELVVDTGHLVAFTQGLEYSIGKVGGLRSLVLGGEGLVMRFQAGEGGRVWIQTRNLVSLAKQIVPFMPSRK